MADEQPAATNIEILSQANAELAKRYVNEVVNQGNLDVIPEIYAQDYENHTTAVVGTVTGHDGVRDMVEQWRMAFPDVHATIEDVIATGDRVVTRISVTGTHEGEWRGFAPTGHAINIRIISIFRIEDGLIKERWENADMVSLLAQLGIS